MAKLKSKQMINDYNILSTDIFYFKLIYEQRSIHGAARKISQDPANISRNLSRLESHINQKLFTRHKTGLKPTESGEQLYKAISGAQNEFTKILNEKTISMQKIRIGFAPSVGFAHFRAKMVDCLIELNLVPEFILSSSSELIEMIKSRELDLVLSSAKVKFPSLITKPLCQENLILCSRSGRPEKILALHPDMLTLEKIVYSISYQQKWMLKDYFVIAKLAAENESLMCILPESLLSNYPDLKTIETYPYIGKITALTWPESVGAIFIKRYSQKISHTS